MSVTVTIQAAIHIVRSLMQNYSVGDTSGTLADRLLELLRDYNNYGQPTPAQRGPSSLPTK